MVTHKGEGRKRSGEDEGILDEYSSGTKFAPTEVKEAFEDVEEDAKECPKKGNETKSIIAKTKEELLLMAYVEVKGKQINNTWYLDSGCSNHMSGTKKMFTKLDEKFRENVKLGNDSSLKVQGKGDVKIKVNGAVQIISGVFCVPDFRSNLISLG
ncbi:unnamed protein product [Prunus armeniaca]